jgi:hypothetical protein
MTRTSKDEFSAKVKRLALARCVAGGGACECGCGRKITIGKGKTLHHFDHHLAAVDGGKPTLENCRVVLIDPCHKAKSATEKKTSAKVVRMKDRSDGVKKPKGSIPSPPPKAQKGYRYPFPTLPRRAMFRSA